MGNEHVFCMLEDAITLLPQTKLRKLVTQYLNPAELRPYGGRKENLLADVKAFQKARLAGKYYQAFAVNSKNYTEKSSGTLAWIADCRRLRNFTSRSRSRGMAGGRRSDRGKLDCEEG